MALIKKSVLICVLRGEITMQRYNLRQAQCPYLSGIVRICPLLSGNVRFFGKYHYKFFGSLEKNPYLYRVILPTILGKNS